MGVPSADAGSMSEESSPGEAFSVVLFSGTTDKLMAAVVIASGAAAMQKKVTLFLTFWGLMAFRKGAREQAPRLSAEFASFEETAFAAMREKKVPHWLDMLRDAMEIGDVTVKACGMTMDLFGLRLEDLEPVVSEVTGVGSFIEESPGQVLFI
jgi:peroxiredoxin family protein